ncbi:hypothetical protein PRK78_003681 [Emydomyces testavorans]|uniref:Uncharacterized protein n=1 Tax=Emydomyces testavorans TaxID=2070801 RepID=A0AAF0IIK8_9EURO|nr:hypothetical protein PRK78_003681 [Emydomyces testavorans]
MSYTLASKKRKFHRALESLSNGNAQKPPSLAPIPKDTDISTPKSIDPTIKRVRLTPTSEPDGAIICPSKSPLASRSSTSSLRPNFVPWDRDRFLERLETFRRVDRWSPKPEAINEVQWAKRGWSCVDVMRVECVGGCGHSVVVKLPDDIDDLEEYDSEKIEEQKQVHSIHRLLLAKPDNALGGLQERYFRLTSLEDKLPSIECIALPEGMDINSVLEKIPSDVLSADQSAEGNSHAAEGEPEVTPSEITQTKVNKAAVALALFGWDLCGDKNSGLASCKACFRRLGLWMYKPKADGSSSVYPNLDVVNEHLDYCPWVNAKTQSGSEKRAGQGIGVGSALPGWEVLQNVIRNAYRRRTWSAESGVVSLGDHDQDLEPTELDVETRKTKDREWWAKLRRVRQALQVKGPKKKKGSS